jgi:hypothetical protein
MKTCCIVILLLIIISVTTISQPGYSRGVTASVVIPVKTSSYFSKIGYTAGYFEEFFITDRTSVVTGASMAIFKLDKDYKLDDYLSWNVIDIVADMGPKFYSGPWYFAPKFGMIWSNQLEFAIMPQLGIWFEQMDIGLGYTHSKSFRFYEVKLNVYFD